MWLRSSSISLDGYGFKIRKVSRWRSAASNETILATRQEVFFTKLTSADQGNLLTRAKHNLHCIIVILINAGLLNFYFILHCTYFLVKKFIFLNVYISVNTIYECRYMFFLVEKGDINKGRTQLLGDGGLSKMRTAAYRGRGKLWKTSEKGEVSG